MNNVFVKDGSLEMEYDVVVLTDIDLVHVQSFEVVSELEAVLGVIVDVPTVPEMQTTTNTIPIVKTNCPLEQISSRTTTTIEARKWKIYR